MKKTVSLLLSLILMFALAVPALAIDDVVTTADIERAIANGEATAVNEIRDIDSFTQEEIAADEALQYIFENGGISTYSSNTNSRDGRVYSTTVTYDTDVFTYYLMCKAILEVYDVGTASSNSIKTTLSITESVSQNGKRRDDMQNYIRVARISGKLGCGENTAFSESINIEGCVENNPLSDIAAVIGWYGSKTGLTTVTQIANSFSSISSYFNGGKVTKSTRVKAGDNVRAVSAEWNNYTTLNSSDHDLTINGQISTFDSNLTANKTANALAKWKYNVYYGALTPNPYESDVRLQVSTTYLVNVK